MGESPSGALSAPWWHWGEAVEPLVALLDRGGILAIPTESSYALGADPRSRRGVEAIYRIKERERDKPLPIVIADLDQLPALGIAPDAPLLAGAAALWPAPLSILLPTTSQLPASAGSGNLAVRRPAHSQLLTLLARLARPLTATSANRSGEPPLLEPAAVADLVAGADAVVVDGGALPGGPPSTLITRGPQGIEVLRAGSFPRNRWACLETTP